MITPDPSAFTVAPTGEEVAETLRQMALMDEWLHTKAVDARLSARQDGVDAAARIYKSAADIISRLTAALATAERERDAERVAKNDYMRRAFEAESAYSKVWNEAATAERERDEARAELYIARSALEEIAQHPIDSIVHGRSDLGLPGHRGSPTVARDALAFLTPPPGAGTK